jgi:hypothetical protein
LEEVMTITGRCRIPSVALYKDIRSRLAKWRANARAPQTVFQG